MCWRYECICNNLTLDAHEATALCVSSSARRHLNRLTMRTHTCVYTFCVCWRCPFLAQPRQVDWYLMRLVCAGRNINVCVYPQCHHPLPPHILIHHPRTRTRVLLWAQNFMRALSNFLIKLKWKSCISKIFQGRIEYMYHTAHMTLTPSHARLHFWKFITAHSSRRTSFKFA